MKHVLSGFDLIILESESASELLYMIDYLLGMSDPKGRRNVMKNLMGTYGKGFTVWQELKDRTKENFNR